MRPISSVTSRATSSDSLARSTAPGPPTRSDGGQARLQPSREPHRDAPSRASSSHNDRCDRSPAVRCDGPVLSVGQNWRRNYSQMAGFLARFLDVMEWWGQTSSLSSMASKRESAAARGCMIVSPGTAPKQEPTCDFVWGASPPPPSRSECVPSRDRGPSGQVQSASQPGVPLPLPACVRRERSD